MLRVRPPCIQGADELGKRIPLLWPGRMVMRQQKPRRVCRQLADCDAAAVVAPLQLGDILEDGVVKIELSLPDHLCQQRHVKHLADGSEVEERVQIDSPFCGPVGIAIIEKKVAAVASDHDGKAADAVGRESPPYFLRYEFMNLPVRVGLRRADRSRHQSQEYGAAC